MDEKFISKEIEGIKETNLKKLKQLFPSAFKDGQVDFEELKNQLGNFEGVEEEKYEFNWVGKQEAKQNALSNINGVTLKYYPEESKNADTTENLYIEGDNLKVLKLLRNNYANKIKMIYIDPPYNTGNDTFVYPDSFKKTDEESKEDVGITKDGERVINILKDNMYKNTKDSNKYHSAWLSMMYPRLKVAQELLSEDGVIFISIDDNEQENLKKMCNEIFGEDNTDVMVWRKSGIGRDGKMKNTSTFRKDHEYIIICFKEKQFLNKIIEKPNFVNEYPNMDNDPRGPYKAGSISRKEEASNPNHINYYTVVSPKGNTFTRQFDISKEEFDKLNNDILINSEGKKVSRIYWGKDGNSVPAIKIFVNEEREITPYSILLEKGTTTEGTKEVSDILGIEMSEMRPKPSLLIRTLLQLSTDKDSINLDFFSGTATTAHACMQLNKKDGGNRKFIMVQLPEVCDENSEAYKAGYKNICEIGKERIRRAGEKIRQETNANIDYGFKVFKLGETNINWEKEEYKRKIDDYILNNGFLDEKHKEELMKDFANGAKDINIVYEILLRYYGMPLSAKIDKLDNIGHRTYSIGNVVIVCLEDTITNDTIDELSKIDFSKLYLRDSSFKGEKSLELKQNLMTRLNLQKNYNDEKVYKVEFI